MPKLRSGEEWAKSLRQDIKTEIGLGWNVCGHKRSDGTLSGSCKLTHRTEDGRRSSVMLPFRWEASSKRQILNRVIAIARVLLALLVVTALPAQAAEPIRLQVIQYQVRNQEIPVLPFLLPPPPLLLEPTKSKRRRRNGRRNRVWEDDSDWLMD